MLVGESIVLRPVQESDLDSFNIWRNDVKIKENALLHPFPVTFELDKDWFNYASVNKSNNTVFFTITDKKGQCLGYTFLNAINWVNRNAYFGIIIGDETSRGKGYGKQSLDLILKYAKKNLNLFKVTLEVVSTNSAAIKLYETIGFVKEGTLKKQAFIDGNQTDVLIYSYFL